MISGIAALGQRVRVCPTFEVCTRDIIQQNVILSGKQFTAACGQMSLERRLVREKVIEATIKAIFVDLLILELKQIGERRTAIPILGNVQLGRRLAEPRRDQDGGHLCPCDVFLALWKQSLAQLLKARSTPQRERQIDIAKLRRTFDANALQAHRQILAAVLEKFRLLRSTNQTARNGPRLNATVLIELTKMRNRLLDNAPPDANTAN